jgi:hypothetical protein
VAPEAVFLDYRGGKPQTEKTKYQSSFLDTSIKVDANE